MADTPAAGSGKKILGQPWWIWAAGAVALVGGFIYLRSKGKASAAQAGSTGQASTTGTYSSPTGLSWEQFLLFLHDQQAAPGTASTATGSPAPAPGKAPAPAAKKPAQGGGKLIWSGDLQRWMTPAQWHAWHVKHVQHVAHAGGR